MPGEEAESKSTSPVYKPLNNTAESLDDLNIDNDSVNNNEDIDDKL